MNKQLSGAAAVALTLALNLILTPGASAHETWLLPTAFAPGAGDEIPFQMTSGMGFPALGSAIAVDRVVEAVIHDGDNGQDLRVDNEIDGALALTGKAGSGTTCAWVRLKPRVLEIDSDEDVIHYLEEIGAPEQVWTAWEAMRGKALWRESYAKLARTYVATADAPEEAGKRCWEQASKGRLEMQPASNPAKLHSGDTLTMDLRFDGAPLADQAVGIVREGDVPGDLLRSDARGRVTLTTGGPGRYLVYATYLRPADAAEHNWESDFITLTFEVSTP